MRKVFGLTVWGVLIVAVPAQAVQYSLIDLGPGQATAINDLGQVLGDNGGQIFFYHNSAPQFLGLNGVGTGINNSGQIAGYTNSFVPFYHAFWYNGSSVVDVGATLSGESYATGINNVGQVVGHWGSGLSSSASFSYTNGAMQIFGPQSAAFGINDSGQIAGVIIVGSLLRAYIYSGGSVTPLTSVGDESKAFALNNNGQVVGWVYHNTSDTYEAFSYLAGNTTWLGNLGQVNSSAYGINDLGQIVGRVYGNGNDHAFIYSAGSMIDLNSLINPSLGWTLQSAQDINNAGQIVGYGLDSTGQGRAFLLTPVPEPSGFCFLILGLSILSRSRRG
jgi:probable HAF family extracellular repeat protein